MIRTTQLVFFALLLGQIIFAGVIYLLMATNKSSALAATPIFFTLPIAILVLMVGLAWVTNQYMGRSIKPDMRLGQKLRHYQQRVLLRLILIESGVLASGVFAMISANPKLYLLMLIGMGVFTYFRPGKPEFLQEYNITAQEADQVV